MLFSLEIISSCLSSEEEEEEEEENRLQEAVIDASVLLKEAKRN